MFEIRFFIWDYDTDGWKEYTDKLVYPVKVSALLDERLDEAEVQLERMGGETLKPYTPCRIYVKTETRRIEKALGTKPLIAPDGETGNEVYNQFILQGYSEGYQYQQFLMLVLNDVATQTPRGVKDSDGNLLYTHNLTLIETTKLLERMMGESLTFTNAKGFTLDDIETATAVHQAQMNSTYIFNQGNLKGEVAPYFQQGTTGVVQVYEILKKTYKESGGSFLPVNIPDLNGDFYFTCSDWNEYGYSRGLKCEVFDENHNLVAQGDCYRDPNYNSGDFSNTDALSFSVGTMINFTVVYTMYRKSDDYIYGTCTYYCSGIANHLPLKKWTIKDVCERIFDTCEVYAYGGLEPRFYLADGIKSKLEAVIAPEFAMTKMTLREQLQMVGKFINAEPRITARTWDSTNERWRFEVSFDEYATSTLSNISSKTEVSDQSSINGDEYATNLDTSVENLANQLDDDAGAITEPYATGDITLRSENVGVRLGDDANTIIATEYPILDMTQVLCIGYGKRQNDGTIVWTEFANTSYGAPVDITQYVYESHDYQNLDSFSTIKGMGKSLAIYYTQYSKDVKGLYFKKTAQYQAFTDYAIVNILNMITGDELNVGDYPLLHFRVTYKALTGARLKTSKATRGTGLPITTPYNQGANLVESRWFGRNLKGVIARIGNVDKVKTYRLAWLNDIPQIGRRFDADYFISSVISEIDPSCILTTITLSKDFNRLSEYVGISSNKRMWEVSEQQVQQRESVWHTNALFSYDSLTSKGAVVDSVGMNPLTILLLSVRRPILALCRTWAKEQNGGTPNQITNGYVARPVSCIPLGNALCFTIKFDDNYSAGQAVEYVNDTSADIKGFWGNYVRYVDYYGRAYYLDVSLVVPKAGFDRLTYPAEPNVTYDYHALLTNKVKYRKDSRETSRITIEIDCTSNDPDIIIGEGMANNSGYIRTPKNLKSVWLSRPLTRLETTIPTDIILKETAYTYGGESWISIDFSQKTGTAENAVAWALITERTSDTISVEDEDGTQTTQTITQGGDLVIASNRLYDEDNNALDTIRCMWCDTTRDKL